MATTVAPDRRRRYQRQPAPWARYAAPRLGLEPQTAEALVHGRFPIHRRFAELVAAAIRTDDRRLLDKLMAPVDAALARLPEESLTPQLIQECQVPDLEEDAAEAAWHADPSDERKRAWAAAVRVQRSSSLRLLLALEGA